MTVRIRLAIFATAALALGLGLWLGFAIAGGLGHVSTKKPAPPPVAAIRYGDPSAVVDDESAMTLLMNAQLFAGSRVGYAGTEPAEFKAFRLLLASPEVNEHFVQLVNRGSPAAQLYGLCGVYRTSPDQFQSLVVQVASQSVTQGATVDVCDIGCIIETLNVSDVMIGGSFGGRDMRTGSLPAHMLALAGYAL